MKVKNSCPSIHLNKQSVSPVVHFYFELCHLKQIYRQGWLERGISETCCESVAEHSFAVAILAMLLADQYYPDLQPDQVLRLALIHDLGEIHAGDITPSMNVAPEDKHHAERASIREVFREFGGESYLALWDEYEAEETPEAQFIRQIEKLEMALQAGVYSHQGLRDVTDFLNSASNAIEDPVLREILNEVRTLTQPEADRD